MPYWLTNPEHGTMPVYDESEVKRHAALGWTLLNQGESPVYTEKPAQSFDALPGEGPNTPLIASVTTFNAVDQAEIAEVRTKRKYTRKAQ